MEAVLADIYNKNFRESTALDDSPHGLVNIASASKLMTHPRPIENFKDCSLFFLEKFPTLSSHHPPHHIMEL